MRGQPSPVCQNISVLISPADAKIPRWGEALAGATHLSSQGGKTVLLLCSDDLIPLETRAHTVQVLQQGTEQLRGVMLRHLMGRRGIVHTPRTTRTTRTRRSFPCAFLATAAVHVLAGRHSGHQRIQEAHVSMSALRHVSGVPNGSHTACFHHFSSQLCCDMHKC